MNNTELRYSVRLVLELAKIASKNQENPRSVGNHIITSQQQRVIDTVEKFYATIPAASDEELQWGVPRQFGIIHVKEEDVVAVNLTPDFEEAVKKYGEKIAAKIMEQVFMKVHNGNM